MSLYNSLFGVNKNAHILLGFIGLNMEYFDRFRDVELINNGEIVSVLTRLGGGNRDDYSETWEKIQNNELYIGDYDDDFDTTYAHIEFKIPDKYIKTAKSIFEGEPLSFEEKFTKELKEMEIPGTDAYKRAEEIANKFMNCIENGDNKIEI